LGLGRYECRCFKNLVQKICKKKPGDGGGGSPGFQILRASVEREYHLLEQKSQEEKLIVDEKGLILSRRIVLWDSESSWP
jgi:hypothetical protein